MIPSQGCRVKIFDASRSPRSQPPRCGSRRRARASQRVRVPPPNRREAQGRYQLRLLHSGIEAADRADRRRAMLSRGSWRRRIRLTGSSGIIATSNEATVPLTPSGSSHSPRSQPPRCGSRRRASSRSARDACRRCAGSEPRICAMSRLVLPLDSHDSTSPSRVVSPSSLENSAGVSVPESLASRSRNSFAPSLPIYCSRSCSLPGRAAMIAAFDPALPLRAWSSHCGIGSGSTTSSSPSAAKRIRQQFLRLRRRPHDLARAVDGEQIAAGDVEGGARALGQPRIGEVDADPRQHLLDRNRLGHVVDAAGLQAANDVFGFGQPRHEDDRNVVQAGVALQPPAGLEPVHARASRRRAARCRA